MAPRILAILLFTCLLLCVARAEETPTIGVRSSAFLIVDYLPPAFYDGDGLSACFRVENASARDGAFEIVAKTVDAAGAEVKTLIEKTTVAHGAFGSVKFEIDAKRVAAIQFELKKSGEERVLATQNAALVREDDPWPRPKIVNGRMTLENGSVAIPVVQKKLTVEDRTFAPLKWLFGGSKDNAAAAAGKARVFAPGAWQLSGSHDAVPSPEPATSGSKPSAPYKESDRAHADADGICALGPWRLDGSIPIFNAVGQILGEVTSSPAGSIERVVILLPADDLDLGTDPRVYRVALDALLARLTKRGIIGGVVLISPFRYGCNDAHRKALWREIHESAGANSVRAIDPNDWMGEANWRADPATPKIFAARPNAPGRKIIEQALANLIR